MKRSTSLWQFVGFAVTSLAGTLLHFMYNWSDQSILWAPFAAVNESVWEHMKLLFFPMFVFALIESRFLGKEYEIFWCVKLAGIGLGLILIPVLFYFYNGAFGASPAWINIAIFFTADAAAYLFETWLFKQEKPLCASPVAAFVILCLVALAFVIFTFVPPAIPLFEDPVTKTYGLSR